MAIFDVDPDTVRLGTPFTFPDNPNMLMVFDTYLAAAEGDPSGLAMTSTGPKDQQIFGDQVSKAGTPDLEKYGGIESISLGDSIMGAPSVSLAWAVCIRGSWCCTLVHCPAGLKCQARSLS